MRLQWQDVDLENDFLNITPEATKTGLQRHVTLADNAKAWLAKYAKDSGPIIANRSLMLARRDTRKLMAATGADEAELKAAQALIVTLEPKPGRAFSRAEANIIVPDVIVQKSGRQWKVVLNPDVMPKLRINDLYAQALRASRGPRGGGDGGRSVVGCGHSRAPGAAAAARPARRPENTQSASDRPLT